MGITQPTTIEERWETESSATGATGNEEIIIHYTISKPSVEINKKQIIWELRPPCDSHGERYKEKWGFKLPIKKERRERGKKERKTQDMDFEA